ncbi:MULTISPECIES: adenylate/guanylate cyclase domain-containing protein [unclassified Sinorhizobium]|uniref:adenylate/guanylate cyclase domain-containing protein n=1 Tax=unclassified Sinorhizobium TaxID=2613772 RepID=UPI003523395A
MRRRTTILDADVVGYSRLMGLDETGTFEALKAHRSELLLPAIAEHHGRVFKLVGDGTLAEFASAVDAIACAMKIQETMPHRNESIVACNRMEFRIGIHLGDVVVVEDDLLGEAVDVAAKLQEIARPGGICVSQQAYEQVGSKLDFPVTDFGQQKVENCDEPVRVWRWSPDVAHAIASAENSSSGRRRPSIAVLPFVNRSNVAEQEHFSDGFTDELIATLARCRWLLVAARNSSFSYKDKPIDIRQVAEDLEVKYVLEGSVRRSGNRIRITAQLLNGADGALLWAERYDGTLEDVFELQDKIAGQITGTIEPELGNIEFAALRGHMSADMGAWEIYLKGLWHLYMFTLEDLRIARDLLERAIAMDPSFAQAYARLAYVHIQLGWYGPMEERAARIADAITLAERAILLDEGEPAAYLALGRAQALNGEPERGIDNLRNALKLNPSFAQAHFALGQALCYVTRPEEGILEIKEAFRLSPRDPHLWTFYNMLAIAHYQTDSLDEATEAARASLRQANTTFWPAMVLATILGRQGKAAEARSAINELLRLRPAMTLNDARREFYFGDIPAMPESFVDRFVADLRKAGLPD